MTVVPITMLIDTTVMRIANATGIGYRHDGIMRFSNKVLYALNYQFDIKQERLGGRYRTCIGQNN